MNDSWDKQTALQKAARFCAYQERSAEEVRKKLRAHISNPSVISGIIDELTDEGFIDEKRFTESFVKGRFFQKKWGRIKIRYALSHHAIDEVVITGVMNDVIKDDVYSGVVRELLEKKLDQLGNRPILEKKDKAFRYLTGKGFEQDIIYSLWREIFPNV